MMISKDYSTPVYVNGFACKNYMDVGNTKKHIDPAHPRSGPYGINAKDDPTVKQSAIVTFGGALSGLYAATAEVQSSSTEAAVAAAPDTQPNAASGGQLDITA